MRKFVMFAASLQNRVIKNRSVTREEILRCRYEQIPVPGRDEVGLVAHEDKGLSLGLLGLGEVEVHLVTVEVGVVRGAHALVESGKKNIINYLWIKFD